MITEVHQFIRDYVQGSPAERRARAASLRPRADDFERAFLGTGADRARVAYADLRLPIWDPQERPSVTALSICVAEGLAADWPAARAFPNGYRRIAPLLEPGRFWAAWEITSMRTGAKRRYDGLVALDGRWVWFPKPWKVLPCVAGQLLEHWAE